MMTTPEYREGILQQQLAAEREAHEATRQELLRLGGINAENFGRAKEAEAKLAEYERRQMEQKPTGYLYLEEGGYNHSELEKFSREKPFMGMSNNLTVITGKLYTSPIDVEFLQNRIVECAAELKEARAAALKEGIRSGELEFLLQQARKEAVEECAKVCADDESGRDSGCYFAELIRAMMK